MLRNKSPLTETGPLILTNHSTGYSQAWDCYRKRLASLGSGQWTQAGRPPHPRTDRRFSEKAVLPIQVPSGHPGTSACLSSGHPGTSVEVPSGHPDIPPTQEPNGHPDTSAQVPAGHPEIHTCTQWPSKDTNTYCNNVIDFFCYWIIIIIIATGAPADHGHWVLVLVSLDGHRVVVLMCLDGHWVLVMLSWMTTGYLCWCSWIILCSGLRLPQLAVCTGQPLGGVSPCGHWPLPSDANHFLRDCYGHGDDAAHIFDQNSSNVQL